MTEADLQSLCVQYARARGLVTTSIPNEATYKRADLRRLGIQPGIPDLIVALPAGRVVWVELKTPRGRVSKTQEEIHSRLSQAGHLVFVVRSFEDFRRLLDYFLDGA